MSWRLGAVLLEVQKGNINLISLWSTCFTINWKGKIILFYLTTYSFRSGSFMSNDMKYKSLLNNLLINFYILTSLFSDVCTMLIKDKWLNIFLLILIVLHWDQWRSSHSVNNGLQGGHYNTFRTTHSPCQTLRHT